jgi:ketosteroid isomerase-like protein
VSGKSPSETHQLWGKHFNAGDINGLMDLYDHTAIFVPQPGQTVSGTSEIRGALEGFLATAATFEMINTTVLETGDVALVMSAWKLTGGKGPDGNPMDIKATTSDVIRRSPDGQWRFVVDNPWGTG